jgi:hypothetical protein
MRPNPRFEWRLEALSAERAALNAQIERRQMRGNREVKRVQQNLRRAMEPSEEAWRKTLIARLCCCFRCSREPSAPWAAQHQRLREHWRVSALQWMSDQELDDTGAGHPAVEVSGENHAELAQKLGQLQPFIAAFPQESNAWANSHILGLPNTLLARGPAVDGVAGAPPHSPRALQGG